jgi:calcium permeable stress-gated cation channel
MYDFACLFICFFFLTKLLVWIWWNIKHEYAHFISVRQHFLISPGHSATAQARTVLVTGIPPKYLSESALTKLFSHLPGGVARVWLNRNLADLPDLYNRRLAACKKLESAETSLFSIAQKRYNKKLKKEAKASGKSDSTSAVGLTKRSSDPEALRSLVEQLVPAKKLPSHRLPLFSWMPFSLPFMGKKVNSIEWAREEIRVTNEEIAKRREVLQHDIEMTTANDAGGEVLNHNIRAGMLNINVPAVPLSIPGVGARPEARFKDQTYPPVNGAFILFNKQIAAHMAVQTLTHHAPYRMARDGKTVEVSPEDIIWDNLSMNPYERRIRVALSWAATIGLIILWAFPGASCIAIPIKVKHPHADTHSS